ncbi:MAG: restriction endonuclease subunit S [bacterium]|nr:restriction endonuclease subunit S [bacterium]
MARLGEIGTVITGNTPKTSEIENYISGDICFIKPSDILEGDITYISGSEFYISEAARNKARILPTQSVLVTCIGIIGKVAINQVECAFNQQINAIIPDSKKCIPSYLAYAIQHKKDAMQSIANAAVVPILNKSQFSEIEINLPSLDEQQRCASVLDKISNLISLRKQQLAKLDELVKARFVEMFGEPIRNSHGLPEKLLGEVCLLKAGATTPAEVIFDYDMEHQIPCYGGNGVRGYVKESTQHGTYPIIGRQGALCGNIQLATDDFHATEHAVLVTPLEEMDIYWLFYLLKYLDLYRYHTDAAQPGLAVKTLNTVNVPIADIRGQNEFSVLVAKIDRRKLTILRSLDKLEVLKKALMQEYFG